MTGGRYGKKSTEGQGAVGFCQPLGSLSKMEASGQSTSLNALSDHWLSVEHGEHGLQGANRSRKPVRQLVLQSHANPKNVCLRIIPLRR